MNTFDRTSTLDLTVYGYHCDVYQHVNNGRYLEFLEAARWHHYRTIFETKQLEAKGWAMLIVELNIKYKRAARLSDTLSIITSLESISHVRVNLKQHIIDKHNKKTIAIAKVQFALVDLVANRPLRLSEEIKNWLA